jgi:hypothetical protein
MTHKMRTCPKCGGEISGAAEWEKRAEAAREE